MEEYMKPNMELIILSDDVILASCPEDYMHSECCGQGIANYVIELPPMP